MSNSYYKKIDEYLSKKHPNSKVYLISDHHFFHGNILKYERSEFPSVNIMNEYIINSHNKVVNDNDVVIFLGDFSFKKQEIENILSKMNGHKYLILGNHDYTDLVKNNHGFEFVFTSPVKYNDFYLSHYPFYDSNDDIQSKLLAKEFNNDEYGINYHGHIHSMMPSSSKYVNVTCEALDYKPLFIGYTHSVNEDKPLFINSDSFVETLKYLESRNYNINLLISDYIYSMMLQFNPYKDDSIISGSYPMYKKYGFISNFSDLDLALIYDDNISKNKNSQKLKEITDSIYDGLLKVDNINLTFIKRLINMCAFEYTFSSDYFNKGALDTNAVMTNFYLNDDYNQVRGTSSLEKIIKTNHLCDVSSYDMPSFEANFLYAKGDIANLILQILFQKGYDNKRALAIKKLKSVCKYNDNDLDNILARFLLRNASFLSTLRRTDEIDYIKQYKIDIDSSFKDFNYTQKEYLNSLINNPNSCFNIVFDEIKNTPNDLINDKSKVLVKELK